MKNLPRIVLMRTRSAYLVLTLGSLLSLFCSGQVQAQASSASFVRTDTTTAGNWHGAYGADGYSVANDSQSLPSYATFAVQNQQDYTWAAGTTDARALQTASGATRIAAAWYSASTFNFDVNFIDGNSHQFALYATDRDPLGRAETIQVIDAATATVLDTQNISSFGNGLYLVWNVAGHVKINVTLAGGPNAVISGVFFGGSSAINSAAAFVRTDAATEGNWHGAYGADGYSVANDTQSIPSYASFAVQNQTNYTWVANPTDPRALQTGSGSGRIAATWCSSPEFNLDVNFTDGNTHQFALYTLDWDSYGRADTIQVLDAVTEAVLDTRSISSFGNGVYLVWNVSGHVRFNIIQTGNGNAVVSGVFFGGSSAVNSVASFVRTDPTTGGNWHGAYGADGYSVANDTLSIPTYVSFAIQNQANWTWAAATTDVRALQTGNGSSRIAATWYNNPEFNLDVNFTDGNIHQFALYALDWDSYGRADAIQVLDAATEAVLDTRSISGFGSGVYLVWNVSGHVRFNIIQTGNGNAVISGVFFGGSSAINSAAAFVRADTATEGNWHGAYGADGYSVANDTQSIPSYGSFAVQNQANYTWVANPTDPRALQTGSGSGRIAATWYSSPEFNFDVNFTDGNTHQFALYALDWDSYGRADTIQVLDAVTEAVLDTRSISNLSNGVYLVWNLSGHVKFNVIQTGAGNAVVNGVFFGGGTPGAPALSSLAVTPSNPSIANGTTQQFNAIATYSDGSTKDLTSTVTWSSSIPSVATISSTGLASSVAVGQTTIQAAVGPVSGSTTMTVNASTTTGFVSTSSLNTARELHTATLLESGMVLIAGGQNRSIRALASAELYNPATGAVTASGNLNIGRSSQTATLLNNGMVLTVGGSGSSGNGLASAELYDPAIGTFTATGNLNTARYGHSATLLNNGMVLIVGGGSSGTTALTSAELYNPANGTFRVTGNLNAARAYHTATLLNDGTVLVAGGYDANGNNLASAELFNPATGTFVTTGNLNVARSSHTATLLNSGKVLIAEGFDINFNVLASAELYDPTAATFTLTGSPNTPRAAYAAALLNNGKVLFEGGYDSNFNDTASAELYEPTTGTFSTTNSASTARDSHTATLLGNGTVLIAGGVDATGNALAIAELYQPGTLTPSGLVSIDINPFNPSIPVATGQRFTATGTFTDNSTQTLASVTWNSSDSTVAPVTNDSSNQGYGFAVATGSVALNACAGLVCGSTIVTVNPSTLTSITITPTSLTTLIGSSVQFHATGTFADGGTEDLTPSVTWNSSSLFVATINSMGSASAFNKGNTTIAATLGNVSGSTTLVVTPPLVAISITPPNALVSQATTQQFIAIGTYSDGSTVDLTNTATWNTSANTIAMINSAGLANGVAQGVATITASSSGFNAFATLTVTTQLLSIAINPQSPSIPFGLMQSLKAMGTYADGSTQDLTNAATWNSMSASVATVSPVGLVTSVAQGTTTITATSGNVTASTTLSVMGPALLSAIVSPQNPFVPSGATQQFAVAGRYSDGTTRDITGTVTWVSSTPGVATVGGNGLATAATAGTSTITASLNPFSFSTTLTVTSPGPPSITVSVSPAPNAAGWNNSNVTITFVCTPGSAAITNCPGPQTVTSEGANQVVSGTVTDAAGVTATASATINIDKTPPALTVATPTDGAVFTAAGITASGTVADRLSGIFSLTCNGVPITLAGAIFSCNISLNPGVNLIVVRTVDLAGNVALTKMHVTLNALWPTPNSLQITPANASLAVGGSQQFTVVDEQGHPRTDAAWTVDNASLATISTDSRPVLVALATGTVTLTATVQGISAQMQVTILAAPGPANWSVPSLSGFEPAGVFPGVPSADGQEFYSWEVGTAISGSVVQALTSDGQLLWRQPPAGVNRTIPDAFGDLLVEYGLASVTGQATTLIVRDGQTGSPIWEHDSQNAITKLAIRPSDGAVVAIESEPYALTPWGDPYTPRTYLDVFDGSTGQLTLQLPLPQIVDTRHIPYINGCQPKDFVFLEAGPTSTAVSIDASGNIYLEYYTGDTHTTDVPDCSTGNETKSWISNQYTILLTVSPDGSSSTQTLGSDTATSVAVCTPETPGYCLYFNGGSLNSPDNVIPDGQGGALATWQESPYPPNGDTPIMVSHVSPSGGGTYSLPIEGAFELALGENGVAFASGTWVDVGAKAVSFDMNSGQVLWSYESAPGNGVNLVAATAEGGMLLALTYGGSQGSTSVIDLISVDSLGTPAKAGSIFAAGPPTYSWSQRWYAPSGAISLPVLVDQASLWATPTGNPSHNGFSAAVCPCLLQSTISTASNFRPSPRQLQRRARSTKFPPSKLRLVGYSPRSFDLDLSSINVSGYSLGSFQSTGGSSKTYLQLIGDGGFPGGHYNVGDLFNLAAATDADRLTASGSNTIIPYRVSSVQDFGAGLTTNGTIDGGVTYFGHGAHQHQPQPDGRDIMLLALSPFPGVNTNVSVLNVKTLSNAGLAPDVTITLRACNAGAKSPTGESSIAQLIANQLGRKVYAWKVGMWFTADLTRRFPHDKESAPNVKPIYLIPSGGTRIQPCTFTPNQPEPTNCGGGE
jgi:hypothetical protein